MEKTKTKTNKATLVEINEENLSKALDYFGIDLSKEGNPFDKKDTLIKGEEGNEGKVDKLEIGEAGEVGVLGKTKAIEAKASETNSDTLSKGIEMLKSFGIEPNTLQKAQLVIDQLGKLHTKVEEEAKKNTELVKGYKEEVDTLKKANTDFEERIKIIEAEPNERKSAKSEFIEKGFSEGQDENKTVLSLSKNRKEVMNALEARAELNNIEKGQSPNPLFSDALVQFESVGSLSKEAIKELNKEKIFIVQ